MLQGLVNVAAVSISINLNNKATDTIAQLLREKPKDESTPNKVTKTKAKMDDVLL